MTNSKEITKTETTAVAKTEPKGSFIAEVLKKSQESFLAANAGFELDYVYMGTWMKTNKMGQFVERDNEEVNFGNSVEIVLGAAEQRFMLWATAEDGGELLVAEGTREAAESRLEVLRESNPDLKYDISDVQSRMLLYFVVTDDLEEENPTIYMLSLSPTAKLAFGKWVLDVFKGDKTKGIPSGTGVSSVLTKMETYEGINSRKNTWVAIKFSAVGMFNPKK